MVNEPPFFDEVRSLQKEQMERFRTLASSTTPDKRIPTVYGTENWGRFWVLGSVSDLDSESDEQGALCSTENKATLEEKFEILDTFATPELVKLAMEAGFTKAEIKQAEEKALDRPVKEGSVVHRMLDFMVHQIDRKLTTKKTQSSHGKDHSPSHGSLRVSLSATCLQRPRYSSEELTGVVSGQYYKSVRRTHQ